MCVGTKYSCDDCGKSFSLPQNLAIHVQTHRDDQRLHECSKCRKRFSSQSQRRVFNNTAHTSSLILSAIRIILASITMQISKQSHTTAYYGVVQHEFAAICMLITLRRLCRTYCNSIVFGQNATCDHTVIKMPTIQLCNAILQSL